MKTTGAARPLPIVDRHIEHLSHLDRPPADLLVHMPSDDGRIIRMGIHAVEAANRLLGGLREFKHGHSACLRITGPDRLQRYGATILCTPMALRINLAVCDSELRLWTDARIELGTSVWHDQVDSPDVIARHTVAWRPDAPVWGQVADALDRLLFEHALHNAKGRIGEAGAPNCTECGIPLAETSGILCAPCLDALDSGGAF
ncbi:MAG: hypothetical protein H6830_04480 [Planctomycetes bacterium]|nr:hypothetical protein [Planctomycetota bacterium]MCB9910492.1 hypothetical protein [Planctomycetota bacterium]MCB9912618.1 hypothetical protein [Planctomycetota bacterium]